jgi:hypothetical protein
MSEESADYSIGDAPVQAEIEQRMKAVGGMIAEFINAEVPEGAPPKWGFVLLTFQFGDGAGRCNYMSNANRADIIELFKEQLQHLEAALASDDSP